MAILATEAKRVTEAMFIVAAKAVAAQVTQEQLDTGLIYPHQSQIFETSIQVAVKVAERIFEDHLAGIPRPTDIEEHVRKWAYRPQYPAL
jgi:malate dehydrogenase (oxaloacetate-decarboxylating)(NADP+)